MSRIVIVPNSLRDRINAALDVALADAPDATPDDREALYHQLLAFYDQNGYVPDFTVAKS